MFRSAPRPVIVTVRLPPSAYDRLSACGGAVTGAATPATLADAGAATGATRAVADARAAVAARPDAGATAARSDVTRGARAVS
jgi:hypothetical protein